MALNRKSINPSLLFGIGIVCLVYGLGASYIQGYFNKLTVIISLLGLISVLVSLFSAPFGKAAGSPTGFIRVPAAASQWKKYAFIVLAVVFLLGLLAGVNYLSCRCNLRWDLTQARQHTLTQDTLRIINGLRQQVKIVVFYAGIPPKYLEDLLRGYQRASAGSIKTEIIDPISRIGYAAQFGRVISGKERKVMVISGSERKDIDFTEESLNEEQLTNAIIQVVRDKRVVYFLTGHSEYGVLDEGSNGLSTLKRILIANNVEIKTVMLGITERVPQDCDILIVAGPRDPMTEQEAGLIRAYLDKGGDALFLIENTPVTTPDKPLTEEQKRKNPSLNNILKYWGIKIADDIVVDLSNNVGEDVGCPATNNYMPYQPITGNLDYTFYIRPRSISVLADLRKSINLAPLVLTASKDKSWGETDRALHIKFDQGLDTPGPVPIAFIIWESRADNKPSETHTGVATRIVVFTDADFLSNNFIDKYSNAMLGMNVITWLSDLDFRISIAKKQINVRRLDLTSKQKRAVAVILFVMPVFIAAAGIIVLLNRNKE